VGKFGQGKVRYGLGLIKARLQETSVSWVATIIMVTIRIRMANQPALFNLFCFSEYSSDDFRIYLRK
jgi:IS5 family transposase